MSSMKKKEIVWIDFHHEFFVIAINIKSVRIGNRTRDH